MTSNSQMLMAPPHPMLRGDASVPIHGYLTSSSRRSRTPLAPIISTSSDTQSRAVTQTASTNTVQERGNAALSSLGRSLEVFSRVAPNETHNHHAAGMPVTTSRPPLEAFINVVDRNTRDTLANRNASIQRMHANSRLRNGITMPGEATTSQPRPRGGTVGDGQSHEADNTQRGVRRSNTRGRGGRHRTASSSHRVNQIQNTSPLMAQFSALLLPFQVRYSSGTPFQSS